MPAIDFTRYYRPHEVADTLAAFVEEFPDLAALRSIGKSHEGRDLWLMTLTNQATGVDTEKPAFWLDANIHATELTGCMAALHLIQRALTGYAREPALTELLDQRVLYVLPCVNPDGMEQALTSPLYIRSGTRRYPYVDERDGLYPADIDGDGLVLQMRVPDPDGNWKISPQDPRLMRRRDPDEVGGSYYRLYTEGLIRGYDGYHVKIAPATQGLDFNRNFPFVWAPEGVQAGAGPYPVSEPEIRTLVAFLAEHLNVSSALSYHTYSGVILRPYADRADETMPIDDLWTYQDLGARGTAITGYPNLSVYHSFRYHPRQVMSGAFDDWVYDQLGVFAFTVEIWDMIGAAGIKDRDFIGWFRDHPEDDDLKLLAWNDAHLGGAGFVNWRRFDHPQLGPVEIGGWVERYTFRNPPAHLLLQTIEPITELALAHARVGPRLELRHCAVEALGDDIFRLRAIVVNSGYLPTYGSRRAAEIGAVRPIEVALVLPTDTTLLTGDQLQEIGQLEGRANKRTLWDVSFPTDHLCKLEWTVRAPSGGVLTIIARAQRAGCATVSLWLG